MAGNGGGGAVNDCLDAPRVSITPREVAMYLHLLTRLWSMISAMTAIRPALGPDLTSTTVEETNQGLHQLHRILQQRLYAPRPTSTKRVKFEFSYTTIPSLVSVTDDKLKAQNPRLQGHALQRHPPSHPAIHPHPSLPSPRSFSKPSSIRPAASEPRNVLTAIGNSLEGVLRRRRCRWGCQVVYSPPKFCRLLGRRSPVCGDPASSSSTAEGLAYSSSEVVLSSVYQLTVQIVPLNEKNPSLILLSLLC